MKWRVIYYKSYILPTLANELSAYYSEAITEEELDSIFKKIYGFNSVNDLDEEQLKLICSKIRMKSAREYGIFLKVHQSEIDYDGLFAKEHPYDWADITIHENLIKTRKHEPIIVEKDKSFKLWGLTKNRD